jgi:hypothetical protein
MHDKLKALDMHHATLTSVSSRRGTAMYDVIFLMMAIVFVLVAFVAAFTTLNASPRLMRIGHRVILGGCVAAFVSVVVAVWFLVWPLT